MRALLVGLALLASASAAPALAAGELYYGSRAGMVVTVVSMRGIDGPAAIIKTRHTRQNAERFCREYVGKVTKACIDETLGLAMADQISANCPKRKFTNFFGKTFRYLGPARAADQFSAKNRLLDVATGEEADGSSASGYSTNLALYRRLCPSTAPVGD